MSYDPQKHHRRSIRLKGFDYSQAASYFITLVSDGRVTLFGTIISGQVQLSAIGKIIDETWLALEERYPNVILDEYIIMPDHMHAIITIGRGGPCGRPIDPVSTQIWAGTGGPCGRPINPDSTQIWAGTGGPCGRPIDPVSTQIWAGTGGPCGRPIDPVSTQIWAGTGGPCGRPIDPVSTQIWAGTGGPCGRPIDPVSTQIWAGTSPAPTLGDIIGAFKSIATHECILAVRRGEIPPFSKKSGNGIILNTSSEITQNWNPSGATFLRTPVAWPKMRIIRNFFHRNNVYI